MTTGDGVRLIARAFVWIALSGQASRAAETMAPPPQPVDAYVESEMRAQKIPGLALAVLHDGRPLYLKSYGVATLEHAVPV
jgi:CubicO group peptidase (beta-lactamase class C family)